MDRKYLVIDLKSFYASVECIKRGLDSMTTKLVVADKTRKGGICLAVSPALKALGVKNRCRLYEIPTDIDFIIAKPMMKDYITMSAKIYSIYLRFIAKEDIYVYSIDECFLDVTDYLLLYKTDEISLAKRIVDEVYKDTGICATCGIGTNMFLAKVALDITAKHEESHLGYLDIKKFKETIWFHKPITDIWNIGPNIARRLANYGITNLYEVSQCDQEILLKEFGVNAYNLINHANGIEETTIKACNSYKPQSKSISHSQILFSDYSFEEGLLVLKEMVDLSVLDLIRHDYATGHISLFIGYSKEFTGGVNKSMKLCEYTYSYNDIMNYFIKLYKDSVDRFKPIRKIGLAFSDLVKANMVTVNLFTDKVKLQKDYILGNTINDLKDRFGKNAILKGMNLEEKATTVTRNKLIGGHNAE